MMENGCIPGWIRGDGTSCSSNGLFMKGLRAILRLY